MTKKFLSLAAVLVCASGLGVRADDDHYYFDDSDSIVTLEFGGFYGVALQDLYDGVDKIDIFGGRVAYKFPMIKLTDRFSTSPFVESMLGGGFETKDDDYQKDGRYYDVDYSVVQWTFAIGSQLRFQCTERFALTANAKIGLDVEYVEADPDYHHHGHHHDEEDDTAIGFLYGAGIGGEFQISKRWGVYVGLDYLASTAKPDLDDPYGKVDHSQSYLVISAGASFRF